MANPVNRDLLSVGAFLLILVVSIVLGMLNVIGWFMVPSLLIVGKKRKGKNKKGEKERRKKK
jgi:uncharacterized membrane protein YhaH (DUF805 family)